MKCTRCGKEISNMVVHREGGQLCYDCYNRPLNIERKQRTGKIIGMEFIETGKTKKPSRSTKGSAGYDFYMPESITIGSGEIAIIDTGVIADIDEGYFLSLHPRSSLYAKGLNIEGIIDSDYHQEIRAVIQNRNKTHSVHINAGDRFMQGIIMRYHITDDDNVSEFRTGGMGSTGR